MYQLCKFQIFKRNSKSQRIRPKHKKVYHKPNDQNAKINRQNLNLKFTTLKE